MPDSSYFFFQHFLLISMSPPSNSILFLKALKFLATSDFSNISWQQCAQRQKVIHFYSQWSLCACCSPTMVLSQKCSASSMSSSHLLQPGNDHQCTFWPTTILPPHPHKHRPALPFFYAITPLHWEVSSYITSLQSCMSTVCVFNIWVACSFCGAVNSPHSQCERKGNCKDGVIKVCNVCLFIL